MIVAAGTEFGVVVVREDATPVDLVSAAHDILGAVLGHLVEALNLVGGGPYVDHCSLSADDEGYLTLVIDDPDYPERSYNAQIDGAMAALVAAGINEVAVLSKVHTRQMPTPQEFQEFQDIQAAMADSQDRGPG